MKTDSVEQPSGKGLPRLRLLLLAVVAALSLVACGAGGPPAEATNSGATAFCKVRGPNYLAAIEATAPIAEPPSSGRLPFAPGSVTLKAVGSQILASVRDAPKGGSLAYRLERRPGHSLLPFAWTVETTTSAVDPSGHVRRLIRRRTYRVKSAHLGSVTFPIATPLSLGLYRFDIEVRDDASGKSAHYAEYARVMKARSAARLAIDRRSFSPGESAYIDVINVGTTPIGYGYEPHAQRFEGGRWVAAPLPPRRHNGVVIAPSAVGMTFGPGESFGCDRVPIPNSWKSGRYRILQPVYFPLRSATAPKVFHVSFRVGSG